jgi:hypothetical protein
MGLRWKVITGESVPVHCTPRPAIRKSALDTIAAAVDLDVLTFVGVDSRRDGQAVVAVKKSTRLERRR